MDRVKKYFPDLITLAGCACVAYGLSLFNPVVAWVVSGLMLIGLGYLYEKAVTK
jgi:hypothetical protein